MAAASLTFLGTGCGVPMADRFYSSILLEVGGGQPRSPSSLPHRYLLDAGEPCSQRLRALGVAFDSLDAVLLSHGHSDHVAGLPMLLQGAWLEPRRRPLPVFLPGELIAPLRAWLDAVYLPDRLLPFRLEWHAWETTELPAALPGGLRVAVAPTTHLDGLRRLIEPGAEDRFRPYSLEFHHRPDADDGDGEEWRLVCSADLGAPGDLDPLLRGRPVDVLVCELAHFSPEELFAYLSDKTIGTLLFNHLTASVATRAREMERLAAKQLPAVDQVRVVADGERVEICPRH